MIGRRQADQRATARLEELRRAIELREPVYQEALRRLKGEDQEWTKRLQQLQGLIDGLILQYQLGDSGEKAIGLIAQAQVYVRERSAPERIVRTHERELKTYHEGLASGTFAGDTDNDG